jgi:putative N6-adenine-specific DNA methylase
VQPPQVKRGAPPASRAAFEIFAVTAPGLESVVSSELHGLGIQGRTMEGAGVVFTGGFDAIYRANLWLRSASRVVARVAEFEAKAFHELERLSRKVPWEEVVPSGSDFRLRVTCRKSRLYHSDGVADRIAAAIERRVPKTRFVTSASEDEHTDDAGPQLFTVRLFHDRCTINADTSGALLHQRGYRLASGKAPLRETLGAAMVLQSGWSSPQSLMDPMCGSGTIPIEAAMIARRIAPGANRRFAFMQWPGFSQSSWDSLRADAVERQLASAGAQIRGSDRDAGVIAFARENAARAGVADDVQFEVSAISGVQPLPEPGWVLSNPPYGVRVGDSAELRDLYAQFGNVLRSKFAGWRVGILSADRKLEAQMKLPLAPVLETGNGGIPVRLLIADV